MRQVGRFRLVAEVKRGDRITTYRGYDPQEERFVIVKVACIPATQEDPALERLRKEGEIYRKMDHPNIARLIEIGVEGLYPYLVLEFIDGPGLRQIIRDYSPLPQDIALFCLIDLLEGLQFIHDNHLIHRDLKPENLILSTEGRLKICDFDLALENTPEATASNRLTGTVGYFAPEAILGEPLSPQSDLFSTGVILYEMLTGVRPFKRESPKQEITAITQAPPIALTKVGVVTEPFFEELTQTLLAKHREQRPASARQLLQHIESRLQLPDPEQRQAALAEFVRDPLAYQERPLPERRATQDAVAAPAPTDKKSPFMWIALVLAGLLGGSLYFLVFQPSVGEAPETNEAAVQLPAAQPTASGEQQPATGPAEPDTLAQQQTAVAANDSGPVAKPESRKTPAITSPTVQPPEEPSKASPFAGKRIAIHSLPWAYIFVDGDSLGMSSDLEPVYLQAGRHSIAFVNPHLPRLEFTVEISADTPDTLQFDLLPRLGQLQLSINPWAYVYVDGREIKDFSSKTPLILLPGEHSIRLIHPTLGSVEKRVLLKAGELQRLSINLFEETQQ